MHTPDEELAARLRKAEKQIVLGAHYAHYKDETKTYTALGLAIAEADESVQVIYQAEYGAKVTFTRPLASWRSDVDVGHQTVKRFTLID